MAKLVDILARELKVWPDKVDVFACDNDGELRAYGNAEELTEYDFFPSSGSVDDCERSPGFGRDRAPVEVTREQWQAAVDALNAPAVWTGEGLPPVGTVCELKFDHWSEWEQCTVLCVGEKMVFVRQVTRSGETFEGSMNRDGVMFRPTRTPEQIAAEEREKAVREMLLTPKTPLPEDTAYALYDAGYRKQADQ